MEVLLLVLYTVAVFYLGMRHERSCSWWERRLQGSRLFTPHRPRLLVSPHRPSSEAITTARAGAGLSRGNAEPLKDVGATGFVPGWSAACPTTLPEQEIA